MSYCTLGDWCLLTQSPNYTMIEPKAKADHSQITKRAYQERSRLVTKTAATESVRTRKKPFVLSVYSVVSPS